jgi:hypothetical protein
MDFADFLAWAWARHHNMLSWYIRPLFLIPFCYFAYKRSWIGIVGTIIALATSMFWFPAPATPDPMAVEFLAMEQEYLTGTWTVWKIALSMIVPITFTLLGMAFWKRSWWAGLGIVNFMAISKIVWSIAFGGESAAALLPPAIIGLLICDAVIYLGVRWAMKRSAASDVQPAVG